MRLVTTPRFRATFAAWGLALIVAAAIFGFALLVLGQLLFGMLAAVAAAAIVGLVHYAVWGRQFARETGAGTPDTPRPVGPGDHRWEGVRRG